MLLFNAIPPLPTQPIPFGRKGRDQSVLGFKHPIEGRLRHAGSLDDRVDADSADALAVKQLVCRRGDALTRAGLALWRGSSPWPGSPSCPLAPAGPNFRLTNYRPVPSNIK